MDHHPRLLRLRAQEVLDRTQADVGDLIESVGHQLVPAGEVRNRLHAAAGRIRPAPRHRMLPLLEQFAELRPHAFFLQIGANDGEQQDPLRDIVLRHDWAGIMVEPLPDIYARLQRNYGDRARLTLENVAIGSDDGPRPFYHLELASNRGSSELPAWCEGLGSFRRDVVLGHRSLIPEVDAQVVEVEVPCMTFTSLCACHGVDRVDVLVVDTEGYDYEILKSVPFDRFRPTLIVFESFHLSAADKAESLRWLQRFDYEMVEYGLDTWCFNRNTLPKPDATVLNPLWQWLADPARERKQLAATRSLRYAARRVLGARRRPDAELGHLFELSDEDRRYLTTGYDDRTPLPGDASRVLARDNPRLLELVDQYRALDLPAVQHHMWRPDDVSAQLDLRYFRGDNVYVWHYAEHPRAMALVLSIYMRYLEDRGGSELLRLLAEDGAFGAWTVEVTGRGKLSRDRLDSVNEILFLRRHLGDALSHPALRILDIGAGYGRFAHRMVAAHPSLADYCCVDAVPESTFLSEYYLTFRGISPPARVVPLGEVTDLEPKSFDLAVNIHSFSECTIAAIEWWVGQLARIRVPRLFIVPNEDEGLLSREADGGRHDVMPTLDRAGYRLTAVEPVIEDPAVQALTRIHDNFMLFALEARPGDRL